MARRLQPHGLYAAATRDSRTTPRSAMRNVFGLIRSSRARRYFMRVLRVVSVLVVVLVIVTASAFAYLYSHYSKIVDARLASGYLTSRAGVYAAPRVLRAGQRLTPERLGEALRRAGYVEGEASRVWNGSFKVVDGAVEIQPGEDEDDANARSIVRVSFDRRGQIASLTGGGLPLDSYALDPAPLTSDPLEKTAERAPLSSNEVPDVLGNAVLSIEDRRFFEHGPVDLWGVARALFSWDDENQDFKQ